jgi:hypothetical protein
LQLETEGVRVYDRLLASRMGTRHCWMAEVAVASTKMEAASTKLTLSFRRQVKRLGQILTELTAQPWALSLLLAR